MKSPYLREVLSGKALRKTVSRLFQAVKFSRISFDCIAFRGNSGAIVAPFLAEALGKGLILVRKNAHSSHSWETVEGSHRKNGRYVIVDDGVSTGDTIETISREISRAEKFHSMILVGIFLYAKGFSQYNLEKFVKDIDVPVYGNCKWYGLEKKRVFRKSPEKQ